MERSARPITSVIMAKLPEPGTVKTRLVEGGLFSPEHAADLAWAMLKCTVERLSLILGRRVILAVTPDDSHESFHQHLQPDRLPCIGQGPGHLGKRLNRVWSALGEIGPVAFFGSDSPDLPARAVAEIPSALDEADGAIGPTHDGGYWTLAADAYLPELIRSIDWGGRTVYDQTVERARAAGRTLISLPAWGDVDRPDDVLALRSRLRRTIGERAEPQSLLNPLAELAATLDRLLEPTRGNRKTT